jgi:hypothetical protein
LSFDFLKKEISNSSLCLYRIGFGILLQILVLRFFFLGFIEKYFLKPIFFFKYYPFYFIPELPKEYMPYLFYFMYIFAFLITIGLFFRFSMISFTFLFTYFHFYDITYYLNHYYLINLICFLLCFMDVDERFSLKNWNQKYKTKTKAIYLYLILFQISVVYFFGFVAKLKQDWLFDALPMKIWLNQNLQIPILGYLFQFTFTAFFCSYFGLLFDLLIPFLLFSNKYRKLGFFLAFCFHISTYLLFQIGIFPFIMLLSILLFIPPKTYDEFLNLKTADLEYIPIKKEFKVLITIYILFQILFPLRFLYYENLSWREEGFRFSWNIMIIEKRGSIEFILRDKNSKKEFIIQPEFYLTPFQAYMMSTQADMILQFAHFLKNEFQKENMDVQVFANSFVSLNGKESRRFIKKDIDLTKVKESFSKKNWLIDL